MPMLESEPRPVPTANPHATSANAGDDPNSESASLIATSEVGPVRGGGQTDPSALGAPESESELLLEEAAAAPAEAAAAPAEAENSVAGRFSFDDFDIVPSWEAWGPYPDDKAAESSRSALPGASAPEEANGAALQSLPEAPAAEAGAGSAEPVLDEAQYTELKSQPSELEAQPSELETQPSALETQPASQVHAEPPSEVKADTEASSAEPALANETAPSDLPIPFATTSITPQSTAAAPEKSQGATAFAGPLAARPVISVGESSASASERRLSSAVSARDEHSAGLDLERDVDWEESARPPQKFAAFPSTAVPNEVRATLVTGCAPPAREPSPPAASSSASLPDRGSAPAHEERRLSHPRGRVASQAGTRRSRSVPSVPARVVSKSPDAPQVATTKLSISRAGLFAGVAVVLGAGFAAGFLVARQLPGAAVQPAAAEAEAVGSRPTLEIRSIQGAADSLSAAQDAQSAAAAAPRVPAPTDSQSSAPSATPPTALGPIATAEERPTARGFAPLRRAPMTQTSSSAAAQVPEPASSAASTGVSSPDLEASAQAEAASRPGEEGPRDSALLPDANADEPPASKAVARAPFDAKAASAALAKAAGGFGACTKPGEAGGVAVVTVTFAPSGKVSLTQVAGTRFAGTPAGDCISYLLRNTQVPPFSGKPISVKKSFSVR